MAILRTSILRIVLIATTCVGPVLSVSDGLLEALRNAATENEARLLMAPHMTEVKSIRQEVIETIVFKGWFTLAREIIMLSHEQGVDISANMRRAAQSIKDDAMNLENRLNPKYGVEQLVAPAFQWAQNDTTIFITVKYTVRWNAPGAVEATDIAVTMINNTFNFTGVGKHSQNTYRYTLSLNVFDYIDPEKSTWSSGSVGRLLVTLRKKWVRKWPRLLENKKHKIANMHVWSERQENLDEALAGMSSASNSPVTCKRDSKLYCLATDTCKDAESCTKCPGKTITDTDRGICAGVPSEKASVTFADTDSTEGSIGGEIKIKKATREFDIDSYALYYGKDANDGLASFMKLTDELGVPLAAITTVTPNGGEIIFKLPAGTPMTSGATHILAYSKNEYGEYESPASVAFSDAIMPAAKPSSLTMEDTHADSKKLGGSIRIGAPTNREHITEYALHWGKSATKRVSKNSHIDDVSSIGTFEKGEDSTDWKLSDKSIPDSATYILAYSKNAQAEHPKPVAWQIVDNQRPCENEGGPDCVTNVTVSDDADPDPNQVSFTIRMKPADDESNIQHYEVFWGKTSCGKDGTSGKKTTNSLIRSIKVGESTLELLPMDTPLPPGARHILAYPGNVFGTSKRCVSVEISDVNTPSLKHVDDLMAQPLL